MKTFLGTLLVMVVYAQAFAQVPVNIARPGDPPQWVYIGTSSKDPNAPAGARCDSNGHDVTILAPGWRHNSSGWGPSADDLIDEFSVDVTGKTIISAANVAVASFLVNIQGSGYCNFDTSVTSNWLHLVDNSGRPFPTHVIVTGTAPIPAGHIQIDPNPDEDERMGSISVAGVPIVITQEGSPPK